MISLNKVMLRYHYSINIYQTILFLKRTQITRSLKNMKKIIFLAFYSIIPIRNVSLFSAFLFILIGMSVCTEKDTVATHKFKKIKGKKNSIRIKRLYNRHKRTKKNLERKTHYKKQISGDHCILPALFPYNVPSIIHKCVYQETIYLSIK